MPSALFSAVSSSSSDSSRSCSSAAPPPDDRVARHLLANVHNAAGIQRPPAVVRQRSDPRTAALVGLPPAMLDELAHALAAGPIDLDLLQTLLASGFAARPVALLLAGELTTRCVLPGEMDHREQALWREVLLHALRLPTLQWEITATIWRGGLSPHGAALHPLLKALRDAAYRPCGMSRRQWQLRVTAQPAADSHRLALEWQGEHCGPRDMPGRHAWAEGRLRAMVQGTDGIAVARAMKRIRRQEQREHGLLDPHVGMLDLLERAAMAGGDQQALAHWERAAGEAPLMTAATVTGATQALAELLLAAAHQAGNLPDVAMTTPRRPGRIAEVFVWALAFPVQLDALRRWSVDRAVPVQAEVCDSPLATDASPARSAETLALRRAVGDALIGSPPMGTALVVPGDCTPVRYNVPGWRMQQARQIIDFIHSQLPAGGNTGDLQHALAAMFGRATPPRADPDPLPHAVVRVSRVPQHRHHPMAGALTPHGVFSASPTGSAGLLPGAGAQMFGEITGHAPLQVLQGMLDHLPAEAWWLTLPGYVAQTPRGLGDALEDLFALAGEPLHGRPPRPNALQRFLDSAHGAAFFDAVGRLPGLADWQHDHLLAGDNATRVYAFMQMLRQLLRGFHAGTRTTHIGAAAEADRAALHLLAGTGANAGELLAQYNGPLGAAGTGYFVRVLRATRPAGAALPSRVEQVLNALRVRRDLPSSDQCPQIAMADVRRWLVDGPEQWLTPAQFDAMSGAGRCLAQAEIRLARVLRQAATEQRHAPRDAQAWRTLADELVQGPFVTRPWETGVAVYFHEVASMLRGWIAQEPDPEPTPEIRQVMQRVRAMVEPLQQLYSALELPLEDIDPHYLGDHASFRYLYAAVDRDIAPSGQTLARRICPTGAASVRDGLAARIAAQVTAVPLPHSRTLPALWNHIIHGPHALQQWLDSREGRAAVAAWAGQADAGRDPWETGAQVIRDAVLSQLPEPLRTIVPPVEAVPALFAQGNAPVLSLAVQLVQADGSLPPDQAVWLAIALLPHVASASPARLPLTFPLCAATAPPDPHALPALDDLLTRFGLALLHGAAPGAALSPADSWALMSRTQAFADVGQSLLRGSDWAGAAPNATRAPQSIQLRVAQQMLDQYVGPTQLQNLRERFAAPDSINRPFAALAAELRTTLEALHPQASGAALDVLRWLVAGELEQPALNVPEIPYWLDARSLQGASFLHGVDLLEALQPGASAWARFDDVCQLASQLAQPGAHAGEKDAVNALWARTMLRPALHYAVAHGRLPELRRLDAATPAQAEAALTFLQDQLEQQALHLGQLGAPPPHRRDMAARTLTAAGVEKSRWTQRPSDLPTGYLDAHGIVPASTVWLESNLLKIALPAGVDMGLEHLFHRDALVTADDTLQQLMMADAYVSATGPSTRALFDAAFDDYRRRVETGLAGLIETLLDALPPDDRQRLRSSTVTPLRVQWEGHDGYQGLLLRCEPAADADDADVLYIEVFPSAGIARRAWTPPGSGARVEARAMRGGTLLRHREEEQMQAVDALTLVPASPVAPESGAASLRTVARAAARHLWDPWLDKIRSDELARQTRLEAVWDREKRLLEATARFTVPFFACAEDMARGDHSATAIIGCAADVGLGLIPVGQLLGSTVRILGMAGERTVLSLAAEAGGALRTFADELVQQSGVFLVRDLTAGAFWAGSRAWRQAVAGAGWLRGIMERGRALDAGAQDLAHALVQNDDARRAVLEAAGEEGVLAAGHVPAQTPVLLFNTNNRWFRFDPVSNTPYGPPLPELTLDKPLPASLPAVRTARGVRFNPGDGARFVELNPDQWEVWIGDQAYRLTPDAADLQLRDVHGREPGTLEPVAPGLCRIPRALGQLSCAPPVRLQFVPDGAAPLPDTPTAAELGSHAVGYREYRLHTVRAGDDPAAAPLEPSEDDHEVGDGVAPPGPSPAHLMVHEGAVCHWSAPPPIARRKQLPVQRPHRLTRLTAEEATALGMPDTVEYLPIVGGHHRGGDTLGLPDTATEAAGALDGILPVVELGPIAAGVSDGRRLRGIVMTVNGQRSVCVEADTGIFYEAPFAADRAADPPLHFVRLRDRATIADYLRRSEAFRFQRMRASAAQDRRNIAGMAFNYMRRAPGANEDAAVTRFDDYDSYVRWCEQRGKPNVLDAYADKVLSGQRQQETFIRNGRALIPDWGPLQTRPEEEREAIAGVLNTLLPLAGKEAGWEPLTAARLADPEIGATLLGHVNGANLAFARVRTYSGRTVVYHAISDGKRAAGLTTRSTEGLGGDIDFVDARREMRSQPPDPTITSLPVLRHPDRLPEIVFGRELDAERLLATIFKRDLSTDNPLRHLDAGDIASVQVFTVLGTCPSCGGVVLPQLRMLLSDRVRFSVRFVMDYH